MKGFVLSLLLHLVSASKLQGIFIGNNYIQLPEEILSNEHILASAAIPKALRVKEAAKQCAEFAISHNRTQFGMIYEMDVYSDKEHTCLIDRPSSAGRELPEFAKPNKFAECKGHLCSNTEDFVEQSDKLFVMLDTDIISFQIAKAIPFEDCVQIAANVNKYKRVGLDPVRYISWNVDSCSAYYGPAGETNLRQTSGYTLFGFHLVGILSPVLAEDTYMVADMACTARDVKEEAFDFCQQFEYESGNATLGYREPEATPTLPGSTRPFPTSGYYSQISQTTDSIYDESSLGMQPRLSTVNSRYYSFTPNEAFDRCAKATAALGYKSFNLVYRVSGYTCTSIHPRVSANSMREAEQSVVYSWLYSKASNL